MIYYTYVLKCSDETLYVGATNNIEKRLKEHNTSKQGAHYTKIRRPVELMYKEEFETLSESRKREVQIKKMSRAEKLQLAGIR
jgi:putative endonuclease